MTLAFHSHRLDSILNGDAYRLIENGEIQWDTMRKARINSRLLHENLRMNGSVNDPEEVAEADYEPSGNISVVKKQKQSRVLEIDVREGVQTVRIELA